MLLVTVHSPLGLTVPVYLGSFLLPLLATLSEFSGGQQGVNAPGAGLTQWSRVGG